MSAPTQVPAPARQSGREHLKVDKNHDYNCTLQDEEQHHQQCCMQATAPPPLQAPETLHPPALPSPEFQPLPQNVSPEHIPDIQLPDLLKMDANEVFFVGILSMGPRNHELPSTLREVFSTPEGKCWHAALEEELQNLCDNCVYKTIPISLGVKPITSKPVLYVKLDKNGGIKQFKIHIGARGFTQKAGINDQDVFAPVTNLKSVRVILALTACYDLELDQMDVSAAYLNGELDEELYLLPPDGVAIDPGHRWRLKWSFYGLKQAGCT
ncbi:Retrovirus-related Pol polyprotein from transposon TNT 1-94 [Trametes pubescens]|uniref:Retrovirus-related Pol polyprotein from transposon TNT 1-94 n=1 Tax=Trametes pubescens TaxID=154538 RepID=A0A1M2V1W7_TRAPU|nr:Retrovirus-related Pol polyprotein from transposon TNT 1-94 [Trametes pubescens]